MDDDLLPPQIQVGAGLHTLDVHQRDEPGNVRVIELLPSGRKPNLTPTPQRAARAFTPGEEPEILPWLAEAGAAIGVHLDKLQKQRLRQAGYRV